MAWSWLRKGLAFGFGTFMVLFLVLGSPAAAQTSDGVTLQVEPFLDGHFKFGEWLPLRITLINKGAAISGEVRVDSTQADFTGAWVVPVDLPAGAEKQVTLYFMPPSYASAIRVRLLSGTQEIVRQSAPLVLHPNTDYLVGVIAARTEPFAVLNGISLKTGLDRSVRMLPLGLNEIPDRVAGLGALDALVISDLDTGGLSTVQKETLASWVRGGGHLVVGGGASAARTLGGLPEALIAPFGVRDNPVELTTLEALGTFGAQPVRVSGPFVANFASTQNALIEQAGQALVAEQRFGQGKVTYSALDLSASPFDAWAGASPFWQKLLLPGSNYPTNMPNDVAPDLVRSRFMTQVLQFLPDLAFPSLNLLGSLLAVYILLVGPLNYLVLRRLKKLDWGWLTIPGLTCLFAVGSFGVSNQLRGGDVILNQLSVASLYADGTAAPVKTYVGVFSPTRETFTLEMAGQVLAIPVAENGDPFGRSVNSSSSLDTEIIAGDPTRVSNIQVNQGALRTFAVESEPPANWGIESDLKFDSTRLRGTLSNHLGEPLTGIIVVSGDRFTRLPDLAPGEKQTLEGTWQPSGGYISNTIAGNRFEDERRRQALNNYFSDWNGPRGQSVPRPLLIGWLAHSPLNAQITNHGTAKQGTTLVVADINLEFVPGTVLLQTGDWTIEQAEASGSPQTCGAPNYVGVTNGSLVLRFRPQVPLSGLRVTKLTVDIEDGRPRGVELRTTTGEWINLEVGGGGQTLVPEPDRFVQENGTVHLRVTNESSDPQCAVYMLALEGNTTQ